MNLLLRILLPEILVLLQATVKNPHSMQTEVAILTKVRDAINEILGGIPGIAPSVKPQESTAAVID